MKDYAYVIQLNNLATIDLFINIFKDALNSNKFKGGDEQFTIKNIIKHLSLVHYDMLDKLNNENTR